ncbi:MAG: UDP-N-acetylmuramoyl-L-alanine--D-glutamate ligase [Dehalococcoidia bacterium]|nr:UDP-N-acetylmuramoyl-L-alanine--D-glutamate ligase [Dehalococcoidia bacterium]
MKGKGILDQVKGQSSELSGLPVTVVGLGMEGVDLVRYLAARGAEVTVSDARDAERLAGQIKQLAGLRIQLSLGENSPEVTQQAAAVYVSQGVPLDLPAIEEARRAGVPIRSMMQTFLEECRGTVVGVTGSSGKSTTTALLGDIFKAAGRDTFVGGNIGVPLLSNLEAIGPGDWVVLEISHTQLELTDVSPHIACVTNVTPNHLDRFRWDDYVDLKRNIVRHQASGDIAVLNRDHEVSRGFAADTPARKVLTSLQPIAEGDAAFLAGRSIVVRIEGRELEACSLDDVRLPGRHNIENVLSATATAVSAGLDTAAIKRAIQAFHGIAHRLELVRRVNGVRYYNDSIATTPERTIAGMRALDGPLVLLLGGRHKHLPWEPLVSEVAGRCRAVICFGEAAHEVREALATAGYRTLLSLTTWATPWKRPPRRRSGATLSCCLPPAPASTRMTTSSSVASTFAGWSRPSRTGPDDGASAGAPPPGGA